MEMKRVADIPTLSSASSHQAWIVTDGHAGNLRQAEALAAALGQADSRNLVLRTRPPWRWLAPRLMPGIGAAFDAGFASACRSPPPLVIGCGRQAALASRWLRGLGSTSVQILDPRIDPVHWDAVVVPEHDRLRGDNVVTLLGSLHPVDDDWLSDARERFTATFEALPAPRTTLLVGGSSRHVRIDMALVDRLLDRLLPRVHDEGGCLLVSTSRRTPVVVSALLRRRTAGVPGLLWTGPGDGPNPYPGLLAWADRIVCTPDSVNMLSEACATRVPVLVADPQLPRGRLRGFIDPLLASGRILPLDGETVYGADDAPIRPLRETARVAAALRRLLPSISITGATTRATMRSAETTPKAKKL